MPKKKETRGRKRVLTPAKKKKATLESIKKCQKETTRCINVRYHKDYDADILEKLDQVENKADYIRQLIRKDIESNSK